MGIEHQVSSNHFIFSENENERQELEFLRLKVPSLEKDIEEGSSQNIPAVKYHFNKLEPPTIQVTKNYYIVKRYMVYQ